MKEQIIAILKDLEQGKISADTAERLIESEMLTEQRYTAKDVDMAYIIGAFNSARLDGLGDELKRLKELKKQPHEIVDEIRNRMNNNL